MDKDGCGVIVALLVFALICVALGEQLGEWRGGWQIKNQAVRDNVAHYVLEDDGGSHVAWGPKPEDH